MSKEAIKTQQGFIQLTCFIPEKSINFYLLTLFRIVFFNIYFGYLFKALSANIKVFVCVYKCMYFLSLKRLLLTEQNDEFSCWSSGQRWYAVDHMNLLRLRLKDIHKKSLQAQKAVAIYTPWKRVFIMGHKMEALPKKLVK